jgi:hypothetical protein
VSDQTIEALRKKLRGLAGGFGPEPHDYEAVCDDIDEALNDLADAESAADYAKNEAARQTEIARCANAERDTWKTTAETFRKSKDGAYTERNKMVVAFAKTAMTLGWIVGVGKHSEADKDWEKDWRTILFVDTPAGQASWHFHDSEVAQLARFPPYSAAWDGHTTEEKYKRLAQLTTPSKMSAP